MKQMSVCPTDLAADPLWSQSLIPLCPVERIPNLDSQYSHTHTQVRAQTHIPHDPEFAFLLTNVGMGIGGESPSHPRLYNVMM